MVGGDWKYMNSGQSVVWGILSRAIKDDLTLPPPPAAPNPTTYVQEHMILLNVNGTRNTLAISTKGTSDVIVSVT